MKGHSYSAQISTGLCHFYLQVLCKALGYFVYYFNNFLAYFILILNESYEKISWYKTTNNELSFHLS